MPLDALQEQIARTALSLPEARPLALAGGGAMIAHGFVDRATKDVDLFTEVDDQEALRVVVALRRALEQQRLVTRDTDRPPLDHRFVTVEPDTGAECTVEVFADGGRLRGIVTLDIGPVLHPEDLAADKVLALWDRARPRDYFDVGALISRFGRERLLELAAAKDSGFSSAAFVDSLRAIARLGPADWAEDGVPPGAVDQLRATFDAWRAHLTRPHTG
jgi:hypothetical protein